MVKLEVKPTGVVVRNKYLQLVCGKQDRQREKNDNRMACGQPEDLPQKWKHSGRPDQKTQWEKRKIGGPNNPPSKGAQVSGDEARLSRAEKGENRHDRLSFKNP